MAPWLGENNSIVNLEGLRVAESRDKADRFKVESHGEFSEDFLFAGHVDIGVKSTKFVQKLDTKEVGAQGWIQVFVEDDITINEEV